MPEGDTVWRTARHLHRAFAGSLLTNTDFRVPKFATFDLSGQRLDEVVSHGKHILMRVGDHTIHSHLKMEGSWHLYMHGSRWRRPAFQARAIVESADWQAVGFSLGILEIVPRAGESSAVGHLGPDLLGADWDADEALRRLATNPSQPIFVALHDQQNLAGLGNEYVNELCFLSGLLPTRQVDQVVDLSRVIERGRRLILANRDRVQRSTTGDLRPGQMLWVFGRDRRPCRRCGTTILAGSLGRTALQLRNTFWCPTCQH